jgi:hypothetical protein
VLNYSIETRFEGYFSLSELRRRGWTQALFKKFLSEPCRFEENPHCNIAGKMQLFAYERIQQIESYPEFRVAHLKSQKKSTVQYERLRMRSYILVDMANAIKIDAYIPSIPFSDLLVLARHYQQSNEAEGYVMLPHIVHSNYLLVMEYLKQQCEPLFWNLDEFYHKPGISEARSALQNRIYTAIAKNYPMLERECNRLIEINDVKIKRNADF